MEDVSSYITFAITTAKEAGDILMAHYGKMQQLEWNKRTHFKTVVDDLSDRLIRARIHERYPEHSIFSEEAEGFMGSSEYSWIVDPLDGTIQYRYGCSDHFGVCIALAHKNNPIVGVNYLPLRKELYVAQEGQGATCNGAKIRALEEHNLNHALVGVDGGKETSTFKRSALGKIYERLYQPEGITCALSSGCASALLSLVACGKLHAYLALSLEPWDMAASAVITSEAGATVTTIDGRPWTIQEPSILVAHPSLHAPLLNLLQGGSNYTKYK